MTLPTYNGLVGPFVALLALGVVVLLCRWTFSTTIRDARRALAQTAQQPPDHGLLVVSATAPTRQDAELLRDVVLAAGIRCTVAPQAGQRHALLVFPADAPRASQLVG